MYMRVCVCVCGGVRVRLSVCLCQVAELLCFLIVNKIRQTSFICHIFDHYYYYYYK